jgi:hypothetical protein
MALQALHEEVVATLTRLKNKHPELKPALEKSAGYAVFPSMGRASAVLGGAYGRGEVYEDGKPIGIASLGQLTLGVQVGGQTFSEVVFFKSQDALDRFKQGRIAFTANASAVIVRAAASGTTDYESDVTAKAFARGGMLLEVSLGGQRFKFTPQEEEKESKEAPPEEHAEAEKSHEEQSHAGEHEEANAEPQGEATSEDLTADANRAARATRNLIDKALGAPSKVAKMAGRFRSHYTS